jgi:hypothetical protein
MKILNSYQAQTLQGTDLFCAEMCDGSTWFIVVTESVIYTTIDDLENGGFMLEQVHKCKVTELPSEPQTMDQFIGHVNYFINY